MHSIAKFSRHHIVLLVHAVIVSFISAATADARTVNVRITLKGACRTVNLANGISAVINGNEAEPLHPTAEDRNHWSGDWEDPRNPAFPDARISASVRLGGARTY